MVSPAPRSEPVSGSDGCLFRQQPTNHDRVGGRLARTHPAM
jgi:hypothetical protein